MQFRLMITAGKGLKVICLLLPGWVIELWGSVRCCPVGQWGSICRNGQLPRGFGATVLWLSETLFLWLVGSRPRGVDVQLVRVVQA